MKIIQILLLVQIKTLVSANLYLGSDQGSCLNQQLYLNGLHLHILLRYLVYAKVILASTKVYLRFIFISTLPHSNVIFT